MSPDALIPSAVPKGTGGRTELSSRVGVGSDFTSAPT